MSDWYGDVWQCARCTLFNNNNITECAACLHPKTEDTIEPTADETNNESQEAVVPKSNNPHCFNKCGSGLRISGHDCNTITCHAGLQDSSWNTCYGAFNMNINKNKFKIYLLVNNISIADGICIGICSSDQHELNSYFHKNGGYGYKSDGKSFFNGIKTGKSGNGYKSGDIITLSIKHKNISWLINDAPKCVQKGIDTDNGEYKLAISMMKKCKNDSITILNVEKTEINNAYLNDDDDEKAESHQITRSSPIQQRRIVKKMGYFVQNVGESWYALNKKWYDRWVEYTMFNKDDTIIDKDKLNNTGRPGPIDNSDLIISDQNTIDIVYGFIHQIQETFPVDSAFYIIPKVVQKMCLSYYAYPILKKDIVENSTHIWIHCDVWDHFFLWFGGGPSIARKVYEHATYKKEQYICVYPVFVKLVYCDGKTGDIDYNNYMIRSFPPDYTLKQMTREIEDDEERDDAEDTPSIHLWLRFGQIKQIYLVDKTRAKVTEDDLKNEDEDRLVEVPDDFRKIRLDDDDLMVNDNVIIVEKRQNDSIGEEGYIWPRAKGDDWRDTIQAGDIIDAKDEQDKWYETFVRYVYPKGHEKEGVMTVHYIGWNIKWDEELAINNEDRVAQRHLHTKGPHRPRKREYNYDYAGFDFNNLWNTANNNNNNNNATNANQ